MRKAILSALLSLAVLAGITAASQVATASQDVTGLLVDVRVAITSETEVVAPGELALFEVTVSNAGLVPVASTLSITFPEGWVYDDDLSTAECGPSTEADATCPAPASPESTFELVASVPEDALEGPEDTTARVDAEGPLAPLEFEDGTDGNNEATAQTEVDPDTKAGFIPEGGSMTADLGDGRVQTVEVPVGSAPGVIVTKLEGFAGAGKTCGENACGDGFLLKFEEHDKYKAHDPANPLITKKTFGAQDPCRGLGSPKCSSIWFAEDETVDDLDPMQMCAGASGGEAGNGQALEDGSPCINQKFKISRGDIWFDVRMLSKDPLELPLGGLL